MTDEHGVDRDESVLPEIGGLCVLLDRVGDCRKRFQPAVLGGLAFDLREASLQTGQILLQCSVGISGHASYRAVRPAFSPLVES